MLLNWRVDPALLASHVTAGTDLDVAALAGKPDSDLTAKGQGLRCFLCLCGEWPNQEFLPNTRGAFRCFTAMKKRNGLLFDALLWVAYLSAEQNQINYL